MIDNLLGDDDDDETADELDDEEIGGLFDDPGDGAIDDGMDGSDDDLMGGGDDLMGGDEMSFSDADDEGTTNSEMTNRIDELENEVASLSSSVNTVKSENEQISESLDDVEENIRKLLEVYEMVTRGVNPFVNENELGDAFGGMGEGGGGGSGGGESMGLFGGDEQQEGEASSDINESIANADADAFFDDDFDDGADSDEGDDFDDGADSDEGDDFDDGEDLADDGFEESVDDGDEFEDGGLDEPFEDDTGDDGGSGGGKSFEELKSKYESGDAAWEDGKVDDESDADADDTVDEPPVNEAGDAEPEIDAAVEADDPVDGPGPEDAVAGGKPYLQELPGGYVADVVVMDWLEFLVDEGGVDGAARTIAYYEAINWVSATAAERLQTYLQGFGDDVTDDPEPRSWLTVSHHETSLRFIGRIDDPSMELLAFDDRGGQSFPGEIRGGDPPGRPRPVPGVGAHAAQSPARAEYELESDGGQRTPSEDGAAQYEPAATRRRRGSRSGNDDGSTDEVGYGGFVWNDGGR